MRNTNHHNYTQQIHLSDDSLYMETYERRHVEQFYQSSEDQLICWGKESNYLDSEFCSTLEKALQGSFI